MRQRVLRACSALPPVEVPTHEALGLVTAEPVLAVLDVPRLANSGMDRYAVRAGDTAGAPVDPRAVASLMAGAGPSAVRVGAGETARIMTGAPVREGADAVVMVGRTHAGDDGHVCVEQAVAPDTSVRPVGEDVAAGAKLFPSRPESHFLGSSGTHGNSPSRCLPNDDESLSSRLPSRKCSMLYEAQLPSSRARWGSMT